jgi:hypothetical protein
MARLMAFALPALLMLTGTAGAPVQAQEIAQADRVMIESRIAAFDAAMKAGRIEISFRRACCASWRTRSGCRKIS